MDETFSKGVGACAVTWRFSARRPWPRFGQWGHTQAEVLFPSVNTATTRIDIETADVASESDRFNPDHVTRSRETVGLKGWGVPAVPYITENQTGILITHSRLSTFALHLFLVFCAKQALQPLLRDSPVKVQKYVLRQFAQLLPHDVEARRAFVQNGGLQFLQVRRTYGGASIRYQKSLRLLFILCSLHPQSSTQI